MRKIFSLHGVKPNKVDRCVKKMREKWKKLKKWGRLLYGYNKGKVKNGEFEKC